MTYKDYLAHYFAIPDCLIFLAIAVAMTTLIYVIFFYYAKAAYKKPEKVRDEFISLTERFYELVFSGCSIIGFMAIYYLINRFLTDRTFRPIWDTYKDYLLLLLMIISIVMNTFMDHVLVRIKHLDRDAMASIRLIGMLYMILIFAYIKLIYEDDNYDMFIAYFLTLMVGRFVYFDASFKDFLHCIKQAAANFPILIIALIYLGAMCAYGYTSGYLLKHNGVITNIFFTHLYMVIVIVFMHFIPEKLIKKETDR